jgi:acyl transferase domain-containing protein
VKFVDVLACLRTIPDGPNVLVEIGPHSALKNPITSTLNYLDCTSEVTYLPSLVRGGDDQLSLLNLCTRLFTSGVELDFSTINQTSHTNATVLTDLPPYKWNKSSYRHISRAVRGKLYPGYSYNRLIGWKSPYDVGHDISFRQIFTLDDQPWLRDHKVLGEVIFPVAGFLALVTESVRTVCAERRPSGILMKQVSVERSLALQEDERVDVTTRLRSPSSESRRATHEWAFEVMSWSESTGWVIHCHGTVQAEDEDAALENSRLIDEAIKTAETAQLEEKDAGEEYAAMKRSGVQWGRHFQLMTSLRVGYSTAPTVVHDTRLRPIDLSRFYTPESLVTIDPPVLDSFGHAMGAVQWSSRSTYVPTFIERARISNRIQAEAFTTVTRMTKFEAKSTDFVLSMATFATERRTPVLELSGLQLKRIATTSSVSEQQVPESYAWTNVPSLDLADEAALKRTLPPIPPGAKEMRQSQEINRRGSVLHDTCSRSRLRGGDEGSSPGVLHY